MSISHLLIPSSSALRWKYFCLLEALVIHLILSCTWFCNGILETYGSEELTVNVDYNIYVTYKDPYYASVREHVTSDLDPRCLNLNEMSYMGLSNACYRLDFLCSPLQSPGLLSEESHSKEAEVIPRLSDIGSIFRKIREKPLDGQKLDLINLDASSFPLPMVMDVKPHLLDWVNYPIEDAFIEMERIPFSGWWSKSASMFSSFSLTVYTMEFKSSVSGIMHSLFKKVLRGLSMKKIYAVTFFAVSLMFLRHCSSAPRIMQWFSKTYLFLGGNNSIPIVGSDGNSTKMHKNQEISRLPISHKMDVKHSLKKKSGSLVMNCGDNAEQSAVAAAESVVSHCAKLEPVNCSVDKISQENKNRELPASPKMKSAVVINTENGDFANIGTISVKVGKEKRKKKRRKGPRAETPVSMNSPGSQSGHSTPPTPMSPVTSVLLPNQSTYAKPEKHKNPRSPIMTMGSCVTVKSAVMEKSPKASDLKLSLPKKVLADASKQTLNAPVSGSSASFPAVDYHPQYLYSACFLPPPSVIVPHARAPGPKLCKTQEKVALVKDEAVSDFTYNIWGDSFFGFDRIGNPKEPSVTSLGYHSDSFSFFAEGPAFAESFHPRYVSPFDP